MKRQRSGTQCARKSPVKAKRTTAVLHRHARVFEHKAAAVLPIDALNAAHHRTVRVGCTEPDRIAHSLLFFKTASLVGIKGLGEGVERLRRQKALRGSRHCSRITHVFVAPGKSKFRRFDGRVHKSRHIVGLGPETLHQPQNRKRRYALRRLRKIVEILPERSQMQRLDDACSACGKVFRRQQTARIGQLPTDLCCDVSFVEISQSGF